MSPATSLDPRAIQPEMMAISVWLLLLVAAGSMSVVSAIYLPLVIALPLILFTSGCFLAAGFHRRHNQSGANRVPVLARTGRLFSAVRAESSGDRASRVDRILSIALFAVLFVVVGVTVAIIVVPYEGEPFTEFYILGPKGKAADYPTEFMAGTPQTVIIGIGNHEHRDVTYTVETFAIESRFDDGTDQPVIVSATLLDRYSVTVPHNQTVEQPYTFRVRDPNVNRIEFLLFKDGAPPADLPASDHIAASYRDLHLWLLVH